MFTETYKHFPQSAWDLLDVMLALDPDNCGSALQSDFFNTQPFACEPSSLPKHVPHKDKVDGKGQDEKGRRQRAGGAKAQESDPSKMESIPGNPSNAPPQEIKAELNLKNAGNLNRKEGEIMFMHCLQIQSSRNLHCWAGLLDKIPWEEAVRTCPPLSRGVRHPTIVPDMTSQGSYGIKQSTSLRQALNSRRNRIVAAKSFALKGGPMRGFTIKKVSKEVSTDGLRPSQLTMGLDGFDLQEDVHHDRNKKPGLSSPAQRIHFSGPLLPQTANVEHIMHEHDQQIQKAFRRTRHEREWSREMQVFGGKDSNESLKGVGHMETYEPLMANSNRSKYRSSNLGEISNTKKTRKDTDAVFETCEFQHELQYL